MSRAEIVRLRLLRLTPAQIAARLERDVDTIGKALAEPDVAEAIKSAEDAALKDAQRVLHDGSLEAVRVLSERMKSDDERISLDAAKTWLTKAGADAPSKSDNRNEHTGKDGGPLIVATPAEVDEARAALEQLAKDRQELKR